MICDSNRANWGQKRPQPHHLLGARTMPRFTSDLVAEQREPIDFNTDSPPLDQQRSETVERLKAQMAEAADMPVWQRKLAEAAPAAPEAGLDPAAPEDHNNQATTTPPPETAPPP